MQKWFSLSLAVALLAGCATLGSPGPAPFQPAGTYDFTADVMGDLVTGTIRIEGAPGDYRAVLTSTMAPGEARARSVRVEDQTITIHLDMDSPMGFVPVQLEYTVDDDRFTGTWSAMGDWGTFRGQRRQAT